MNPKDISRREFLKLMGIGGGAALLNGCLPARLTALRFPPAAIPAAFTPDVEIALRAVEGEEQILPGKATRVRRYQAEVIKGPAEAARALPDSYLGPVFTLQRGQRVRVHFNNELPEESVVHWHGLHVPPEADGHPRLAIQPGETYVYNFTVADRAGTYWFHPHPTGAPGRRSMPGWRGCL